MSEMANGIKEGLLGYQTQKQIQRQQSLENLMKGVQENPETGSLEYTPQKQQEIDLNRQKTASETRKLQYENALESGDTPESKTLAANYKNLFGKEVPTGTPGKIIQGLLTPAASVYKTDVGFQGKELGNEFKTDAAKGKATEKENKEFTKFGEALGTGWTARSGNAGKVQSVINSAERLNGLFSQFPDGNVPVAQTTELTTAVAGMISGGSPQSQHQIDSMVPSTMRGKAEDIAAWVTGNPMGRQQQEFIKQLRDTTNREYEIANKQKSQWQYETLSNWEHLRNSNPDRFKRMVKVKTGYDPDELEQRMTQKAQGFLTPEANTNASQNTKVINGMTYQKVQGGWQKVGQ